MRSILLAGLLSLIPCAAHASDEDDRWLGEDKVKHFGGTAILAIGGYALGAIFWEDKGARLASGAAVGLGAGIAKEIWDMTGRGDPSWRDLAADVVGTGTGLLLAWGADELFFTSSSKSDDAHLVTVGARF